MAGTTTSETCRERLGRLLDAYPMLPVEVIVKEDVLTEGLSFPQGVAAPEVVALEGGPLGLRRIIVRARAGAGARYQAQARDGALVLVDAGTGEAIAGLRAYPQRPNYPYASVVDGRGMARLPLSAAKDPEAVAEAVAETFLLQPWETGELPLSVRLVPDEALAQRPEAEQDAFLLPYVRAIQARIGNVRPLMLNLPPRDWEGEKRLFEAGVAGRTGCLAVWDRRVFARIGPRVGLDWDTWVARLLEQPYLYLENAAQPVLQVGKELSADGGFADRAAALRSTQQGIKFLLDHHVLVRLEHWAPPAGQPQVPVEYYLDLDQFWYETWVKDYREELYGELFGPGRARDPESAFLDVGRGAALGARGGNHRGGDHV